MKPYSVRKSRASSGLWGMLLSAWFLVGMALYLVLSGSAFWIGTSRNPLVFFLASLVYLSGGLLGGIYGRAILVRRAVSRTDALMAGVVFCISVCFLSAGIIFSIKGLGLF